MSTSGFYKIMIISIEQNKGNCVVENIPI
jgi:hypothetical protein